MTPGKKPGVAFWATVVVVVTLVLYPLSIGPTIWFYTHNAVPSWAQTPIEWFYAPLDWLAHKFPSPFFWYAYLWGWRL